MKKLTKSEFETLVRNLLKRNWDKEIKSVLTSHLLGYIATPGFPKFDGTDNRDFPTFVKAIQSCIIFDDMTVDLGNGTLYTVTKTTCELTKA